MFRVVEVDGEGFVVGVSMLFEDGECLFLSSKSFELFDGVGVGSVEDEEDDGGWVWVVAAKDGFCEPAWQHDGGPNFDSNVPALSGAGLEVEVSLELFASIVFFVGDMNIIMVVEEFELGVDGKELNIVTVAAENGEFFQSTDGISADVKDSSSVDDVVGARFACCEGDDGMMRVVEHSFDGVQVQAMDGIVEADGE